jgi:hypothetical protein
VASRERKRAERQKRKQRSAERRAEIAARYEQRNREARDALEPLTEGERPTVVSVGAVISAFGAAAFVVSTVLAAGGTVTVNGAEPSPVQTGAIAVLFAAMAWGMWRCRYWAVLGFQALLALTMLAAVLGLILVSTVLQAVGNLVVLVISGALFYFMIKAMARIQMPERRPPQ